MSGSGVYTIQMHWLTMVWLAVLGVILGGLLFAAGVVTGTRTTLASLEPNGSTSRVASTGEPASSDSPSRRKSPTVAAQPPRSASAPAPNPASPAKAAAQPVFEESGVAGSEVPTPATAQPAPPAGTVPVVADLSPPGELPSADRDSTPTEEAVQSREALAPEENVLLPGGWAVQLGAFVVEENADELVAELVERGYEPYIHRMRTSGGKPLHSVRLWSFEERHAAWKEASKFSQREAMPASVIRSPTD